MAPTRQIQNFWQQWGKPVVVGILLSGAVIGGSTYAVLWANDRAEHFFDAHQSASTPSGTLELPESVIKDLEEKSEQNRIDNPVIVYQASQPEKQWLLEPSTVGAFISILFTIGGVGFAAILSAGGIAFQTLKKI